MPTMPYVPGLRNQRKRVGRSKRRLAWPTPMEPLERRRLLSGAADLVPSTSALSSARFVLAGTAVGNDVVFAGGDPQYNALPVSEVDIYNARAGIWSTGSLSQAREGIAAASAGGKAFFAGGLAPPNPSAVVDIYDQGLGSWSTAALSQARSYLAATAVGGTVLFAGGQLASGEPSSVVDIFNTISGERSTAALAHPRFAIAAATAGELAVFAGGEAAGGGESDIMDLYDADTGAWTATRLPRAGDTALQAASIGARLILIGVPSAGGESQIDIYDTIIGRWSTSSGPGAYGATATVGTKALFAGGGLAGSADIDVYDSANGLWSVVPLSEPRGSLAAAAVGNQAFFAGGIGSQLTPSSAVDIFTDSSSSPVLDGGTAARARGRATAVLQNSGDADFTGPYTVQVYAIPPRQYHGAVLLGSQAVNGNLAAGDSLRFSIPINTANIPAGTYHLVAMVKAADGTLTPFAGATENFTIGKKSSAKPAIALQPKLIAAPMIATFVPNPWLMDSSGILE